MSDDVRPINSGAALLEAIEPWATTGRALLLAGGADLTEPEREAELRALFERIAAHAEATGTAVLDGGTDSGVMRLIAESRTAVGGTFPLIGVAPAGAMERTTRTGGPIEPARDHSLVLLVPGSAFGDETDWLFAAADHLGRGSAPMILVNGGQLANAEARRRLEEGNVVVVVEGTGRAADELAVDAGLRASGRLRVVPASVDAAGLAAALAR